MSPAELLIGARPDYLVPGAVVFIAFHALWLSDRSQRYNLLFGVATLLATAAAALAPVDGPRTGIGISGRIAFCALLSAVLGCYLVAAAGFRGWKWPLRRLLQGGLLVLSAIVLAAFDRHASALYIDVVALAGYAAVAAILWPMGGLARVAAALFLVRALNRGWLTVLIANYSVTEQLGLNLVLSYCIGIALLSAGCLRTLRALRTEHDQLEARVALRSAELSASHARLERANTDLKVFTDTVVSGLRAPLDEMQHGSAGLRERVESGLDEEARDALARLDGGVARMKAMVESLYALAHVASHELRHEAFDVSAAAREVVQALAESHPGARHECVVAPGMVLQSDPVLMHVVLDNLIGNAWKYSARTAQPRVSVEPLPDGALGFVVRDNGAGFDPKFASKLFAPFQRLHDAREFEGTGVGLATVQRVVLRHGGRIHAEGAPGQGAAFFVNLPGLVARDRQPEPG